jgi:hypothetical protein
MTTRERRRTETFVLKLTPPERQHIREAAAATACSSSKWMRHAVAATLKSKDAPNDRELIDKLASLRGDLGRVAGLLNQIARVANVDRTVSDARLESALDDLAGLRQQIAEAVAKVRAT